MLESEPELGRKTFQRRRGAKGVHRDDRAAAADIAFPAHAEACSKATRAVIDPGSTSSR